MCVCACARAAHMLFTSLLTESQGSDAAHVPGRIWLTSSETGAGRGSEAGACPAWARLFYYTIRQYGNSAASLDAVFG